MPYVIRKRGDEWCVYKRGDDGELVGDALGCHESKEKAQAQIAAIWASETQGKSWQFTVEQMELICPSCAAKMREAGVRSISALENLLRETEPLERSAMIQELSAVRALGDERVGGYGVIFGGRDLYNTYFTPATDFWLERIGKPAVLYDHGLDIRLGCRAIGEVISVRKDSIGLWIEAQLDRHNEYLDAVKELIAKGVLGWSSGTASHLMEVAPDGQIRRWPIVEFSLTPTPAEPRTLGVEILRALHLTELLPKGDSGAVPAGIGESPAEEDRDEADKSEKERIKMDEKKEEIKAAEKVAEISVDTDKIVEAVLARMQQPVKGLYAVPNVKKVTKLGFADDAMRSWIHWVRTGDEIAVRAALQEDTASEGGYLVPDDFYAKVALKLGEQSIARAMGATVIPTSRDIIRVPTEGTSMTNFVLKAEEAAYDENEPTFSELALTIYKYTKLVKLSEELAEDEAIAPSLPDILAGMFARAMAGTENTIFLTGAGSTEPTGAVTGGTKGVGAASTSAITAGEVVDLYFSLASQYRSRPGVCWVMDDKTEKVIRKIQATSSAGEFLFQVTPGGALEPDTLLGKRVWNASAMPDIAASAKVILFGDWEYYYIAERSGLVVERNPYLYQANGQIALFAKFRVGGGVAQATAFQYLQMASA
jgi:HK97 family phage major capsid protein